MGSNLGLPEAKRLVLWVGCTGRGVGLCPSSSAQRCSEPSFGGARRVMSAKHALSRCVSCCARASRARSRSHYAGLRTSHRGGAQHPYAAAQPPGDQGALHTSRSRTVSPHASPPQPLPSRCRLRKPRESLHAFPFNPLNSDFTRFPSTLSLLVISPRVSLLSNTDQPQRARATPAGPRTPSLRTRGQPTRGARGPSTQLSPQPSVFSCRAPGGATGPPRPPSLPRAAARAAAARRAGPWRSRLLTWRAWTRPRRSCRRGEVWGREGGPAGGEPSRGGG
jgi:hypothetical protein